MIKLGLNKMNTLAKKLSAMRFRRFSMVFGGLISLLFVFVSDPDTPVFVTLPFGAKLILFVKIIFLLSVAALITHYIRKTLFDYVDMSVLMEKAEESPVGAGLAIIGISVMVLGAGAIFIALANLT